MIEVEGLTKSFGEKPALRGVDLRIEGGEFYGLLGPNGAGKTTLISIMNGFLQPDGGSVSYRGQAFNIGDRAMRHSLGVVPQAIALYKELSAQANLEIFGKLYDLSGSYLRERIEMVLSRVQLLDQRKEKVKNFSGGMQRRLNIAASLLHNPGILFCDEPTVGVDPQSRNATYELLEELNGEGMTVIYTTHYMEEAERLCDRIAIIDHGQIIAQGTLDELLSQAPEGDRLVFRKREETDALAPQLAPFGELTEGEEAWTLAVAGDAKLSAVFGVIEAAGAPYHWFQVRRPNLEGLFLHLTGRSLRE